MILPEDIRRGRALLAAYALGDGPTALLSAGTPLAAEQHFSIITPIFGHGSFEPDCCYGFVGEDVRDGAFDLFIRGTQIVKGRPLAEYLEDASAFPIRPNWPGCPDGTLVHVELALILQSLRTIWADKAVWDYPLRSVNGHSLGGGIAQAAAARYGIPFVGLWESMRAFAGAGLSWAAGRSRRIFSVRNALDFVPDLPPAPFENPPADQIDSGGSPLEDHRHGLAVVVAAAESAMALQAGQPAQ